jgi:hypothetical protein
MFSPPAAPNGTGGIDSRSRFHKVEASVPSRELEPRPLNCGTRVPYGGPLKAIVLAVLAAAARLYGQTAAPSAARMPSLPKIKFTGTKLDNGLRVLISEDHYAPV